MKRILSILCIVLMSMGVAFAKGEKQTVVFNVDLHCQGCVNKIEKNIAFEKGVKDLICDLQTKQVTVVFDSSKTNVANLQTAFKNIGKPATVNVEATKKANGGKCPEGACHAEQGTCSHSAGGSCNHTCGH